MPKVALVRHPESVAPAVSGVSALVARNPAGVLSIAYVIDGDIARLRVPPPRAPRRADRLWEHTCCEVFVARPGLSGYHELNFSPAGEWAACVFGRYRERAAGDSNVASIAPELAVRESGRRLEIDVSLRLDRLAPVYRHARLALALSVVVEDREGSLSYWALKHPPGRPDFHHPDACALELPEAPELRS